MPTSEPPARRRHASVLWRRLNAPGADACDLWREPDGGGTVAGTAVFLEAGEIAHLHYEVTCDESWRTRLGRVKGTLGRREIDFTITVDAQRRWQVNGRAVPSVEGCVDFDLNFTPATNLIQFRRLELPVAARVEAPVAWLEFPTFEVQVLPQSLRRMDARRVDYAAPTVGYAGVLEVHETGFVLQYPELWTAEKVETFDG